MYLALVRHLFQIPGPEVESGLSLETGVENAWLRTFARARYLGEPHGLHD